MQDLDLDELDQAVNNLMTRPKGRRGAKKPADRPTEPTAPKSEPAVVSVSRPGQDDSAAGTPQPVKVQQESPAMPPRPVDHTRVTVNRPVHVPERRRMHPGAMDIIQPSSVQKINAPSVRPGRTAAQLHPTQDIQPEPVRPLAPPELAFKPEPKPEPVPAPEPTQPARPLDTPQDVSDEVLASLSLLDEKKRGTSDFLAPDKPGSPILDEPHAAPAPEPAAPVKKSNDGWPDPLDFHGFSDKQATPTPAEQQKTDELLAALGPVEEPQPPVKEPKETPPTLGAEPVSVTDSHDDAATPNSSPFVTTKVEKRPLGAFADAAHEPARVALPEPTDAPVPHESTSKGELAEASLESKQHLSTPTDHNGFDPTDLRAMAIPPQHHTPEQSKDDVHHVFDTKEYHAAPPHMYAPRKAGPGLVTSIVVLVVLIVAAVLVGYFMMTGTFDVTQLW